MHEVTLELRGVQALGKHGVLDFEYTQPQPFLVDVEYVVTLPEAKYFAPGEWSDTAEKTVAVQAHARNPKVTSLDQRRKQGSESRSMISKTISYATVAQVIENRITGAHVELIETLAAEIAQEVLEMGARKATVTVHKPKAPMMQKFQDVCAKITMESELYQEQLHKYMIGLGANLADPILHLQEACEDIYTKCTGPILGSKIYRSAPVLAPGQEPQPDYYNAILVVFSELAPLDFLRHLQKIELSHGRTPVAQRQRWEARVLDLDIIASDFASADLELTLPHPRARQRRFVLEPLAELYPEMEFDGQPIRELLKGVADQELVCTGMPLNQGDFESVEEYFFDNYLVRENLDEFDDDDL